MSKAKKPGPAGTSPPKKGLDDGTLVRGLTDRPGPEIGIGDLVINVPEGYEWGPDGLPLALMVDPAAPHDLANVTIEVGSGWSPGAMPQIYFPKQLSMAVRKQTWAGYAVRTSGHFGVAGITTHTGRLWQLSDPQFRMCTFGARCRTFGLALGGGVSVNLIFFCNVKNLGANIDGKDFGNGTNVHLSIPATRLVKLATSIQKMHKLASGMFEFEDLMSTAAEFLENVSSKKPFIHVIEVGDAELKLGVTHAIQGRMDIKMVTGRGGYVDDL